MNIEKTAPGLRKSLNIPIPPWNPPLNRNCTPTTIHNPKHTSSTKHKIVSWREKSKISLIIRWVYKWTSSWIIPVLGYNMYFYLFCGKLFLNFLFIKFFDSQTCACCRTTFTITITYPRAKSQYPTWMTVKNSSLPM